MSLTSVDGELGDEVKGDFWSKLLEARTLWRGQTGALGRRCQPNAVPAASGQNPTSGEHRSPTHPAVIALCLPASPHPLRHSQGPFFFRSEVIWSSLPANNQIL